MYTLRNKSDIIETCLFFSHVRKKENMACFILAGRPDCKNYNHALYVSHYLEKNLPDFKLYTIERKSDEWAVKFYGPRKQQVDYNFFLTRHFLMLQIRSMAGTIERHL